MSATPDFTLGYQAPSFAYSLSHPKSFMPFYKLMHSDTLNHFTHPSVVPLKKEIGKEIVLTVSGALPNFDSVGHKILSANHDFISDILQNDLLTSPMKKEIILFSIKASQMGDDIGSHILQCYYNLVDKCL